MKENLVILVERFHCYWFYMKFPLDSVKLLKWKMIADKL